MMRWTTSVQLRRTAHTLLLHICKLRLAPTLPGTFLAAVKRGSTRVSTNADTAVVREVSVFGALTQLAKMIHVELPSRLVLELLTVCFYPQSLQCALAT